LRILMMHDARFNETILVLNETVLIIIINLNETDNDPPLTPRLSIIECSWYEESTPAPGRGKGAVDHAAAAGTVANFVAETYLVCTSFNRRLLSR